MGNEEILKRVRRTILEASFQSGACHIGSALSCASILVDLYFNRMKPNDVFIFSKASGVSALYAVLAEKGIILKSKVAYYLKNYPLPSSKVNGVFVSTGSLGHGCPIACGVALANRLRNVYVLISEGDFEEGTFWESILFAHHHELNNLHIIIDRNYYQACDSTENILRLGQILEHIRLFFKLDIRYTQKGKGVSFIEADPIKWHYANLDKELLQKALKEIG